MSILLIITAKMGSGNLFVKYKGDDREEYASAADRERDRKLEDFFGERLRNVALEPVRRSVCMDTDDSKRTRIIPVNG